MTSRFGAGRLAVCLLTGVVYAAFLSTPAPADEQAADERLRAIYQSEWTWRDEQFAPGEDSQGPIPDHLPKVDSRSQQTRLAYWQEVLKKLKSIDRNALSTDEQLNYDIYKPQIEVLVANWQLRDFEMPANADTTFWTDIGYTARRTFYNAGEYRNWIAQMKQIPRYFDEQMAQMRAGLKRGFTPPKVTMLGREASITSVADAPVEANLLFTPFRDMPAVPPADQTVLRAEAARVIEDSVQPAYRKLRKFLLEEYLPRARTTTAARDLPNGAAYYQAKIREYTTLDETPEAIHAFGESEVARLHQEMLEVMKLTGFQGQFPDFQRFLRTDPQFQAKTPQDLLNRAAWIAKTFDGKASQFFGLLPRQRFAIRPVPDDLAPFYTSGRGGAAVYLVNTYDLPSRPLYNLPALTLHESAPGHSFQVALQLEQKNLPEFRRHSFISAYGEGWALYCERLGVEMGIYETPYEKLGMLNYQIWRAARLVVDTGIHAQGWSRDAAIRYMRQYTILSEHEIETEVDRYISFPAQALSYYLGEAAILSARSKAESALGSTFSIRAFHDAILELGSVPLPVLAARVDRFIAEGEK